MPGMALAGVSLLTAMLTFAASTGGAAAQSTGSSIADTALKYVGTHGGQCWTFMRQVVAEATGRQVGYDYRQGYFDAGAIEVTPEEATTGDIIQIASDSNSSTRASYAGLHTAIILENLGGGRFNAVDSNQNWDEMVRLRPGYDPFAAAARYGLQVHIYRFPDGSASGDAVSVSTSTEPVTAGAGARVATGGDCLNLRDEPSLSGRRITCLPNGTGVTVVSEPVAADGYLWVKVETKLGAGWVASTYLRASETSTPAASTLSAPAAGPADAPAPAATPEPAAAPAADASPGAASAPVTWIHTDDSPGCLRLRSTAGLGGAVRDCLPARTAVTLISDASIPADGYVWVNVRTGRGNEGWVASEFLVP